MKKLVIALIALGLTACGGQKSSETTNISLGQLKLAAGGTHTCVANTNGGLSCWGSNASGEFGNGSSSNVNALMPTLISIASQGIQKVSRALGLSKTNKINLLSTDVKMTKIAAGAGHSCGIVNKKAYCWGVNSIGQNGNGRDGSDPIYALSGIPIDEEPELVIGMDSNVDDIVTAFDSNHSCAIKNSGLHCWGANDQGQIGDGQTLTTNLTATSVIGLSSGVSAVAAGYQHTCAVKDGALHCFGQGGYGQVGDGVSGGIDHRVASPFSVPALTSGVTAVAVASSTTCAIHNGKVKCFGQNYSGEVGSGINYGNGGGMGQVGIPTDIDLSQYTSVQIDAFEQIGAGEFFFCALNGGKIYCWGENSYGQLGDGTTANSAVPTLVPNLDGVTSLSVGFHSVCATTATDVYCWGENSQGQIGDGTQSIPDPNADADPLTNDADPSLCDPASPNANNCHDKHGPKKINLPSGI